MLPTSSKRSVLVTVIGVASLAASLVLIVGMVISKAWDPRSWHSDALWAPETLLPTEEQLKLLHSQLRAEFLIEDVWNVTTPLTAVALLIGALGLFMRRNWGRVLTLGVLVGMILEQTGVLVLLVWLKLEPLSSMVWPDLPVLSVPVLVA